MLNCQLILYPTPRPIISHILGHILGRPKEQHFLYNHLALIFHRPTSTSFYTHHRQPLPPHWGIHASALHMPKPPSVIALILSTTEATNPMSTHIIVCPHTHLSILISSHMGHGEGICVRKV